MADTSTIAFRKYFFMHTLNDEQQQVKQAIRMMRGGDRLIVSGRAGSGKTYAIANSVAGRKALFLAPTHPACAVLSQELTEKYHTISTIHSAIGWHRQRDDDLYSVGGYRPAKEARSCQQGNEKGQKDWRSGIDIIIVDEFSMVGSKLFMAVEDYATEFNLPVVYSGDPFQLPPVKDRAVIMDQGFPAITLTKSIRFPEESEIYRLGETLRTSIESHPKDDVPYIFGGSEIQVVSGTDWIARLTLAYQNDDRLLAVTSDNNSLLRLRRRIRGVAHDQLIDGDLVTSSKTDDLFRNGEQLTINKVVRDMRVLNNVPRCFNRFGTLSVDGFNISFMEDGRVAFILADNSEVEKHSRSIRTLYQAGAINRDQAVHVLDWIEQFQSFELSALATVHKSQGRSMDTVFIDTNTVLKKPVWMSGKAHMRLLYTAITRAKKHVIFYEMRGYCKGDRSLASGDVAALIQQKQGNADQYDVAC